MFKKHPKVELHAHISGSIPLDFLKEHGHLSVDPKIKGSHSLEECFQIFRDIHAVMKDLPMIRKGIKRICNDFEEEGILYCEVG